MGSAAEIILDENIQVIKDDIDVNIFLEYRNYLAPQDAQKDVVIQKGATLINTPAELEAFDNYLVENEDKAELFVSYAFLLTFPRMINLKTISEGISATSHVQDE